MLQSFNGGRGVLVNKSKNISSLNAAVIVAVAVFSTGANAAIVLEHGATVRVGTEYHSNIQFSDDKQKESVYLYSVVPEYKVTALDDNDKWFGSIGVNFERSSNDQLAGKREDPFADVGWEHTFEHSILDLTAGYTRQSSRTAQFTDTGVLTEDGTSTNKSFGASWLFALAEKWDFTASADYAKNEFSGTGGLSDYDLRSAGGELQYKYNERIKPYASTVVSQYRANGVVSNRINYQTYLAGAEMELGPKLSINANAGVVLFNSSHSRDEAIGGVTLDYTSDRHSLTGSLERTVFPTGLNNIDVGDRLRTDYSYALSERSVWGLAMALSQNNTGLDTQQLTASYDLDLTQSWLMHLEAGARNSKSPGQSSVDDKTIGIFFTYTSPKF